jgi:hypothetical protein
MPRFSAGYLALFLLAPLANATPAPPPSDGSTIDAVVLALYDVISGPADEPRDWDRFRALFHPEGRLVPMQPSESGAWRPVVMPPDTFAVRNAALMRTHPLFQGKGFYETEVARRTESYGPIAMVWSTYEGRFAPDDPAPFLRGVNTIDLVHDGERWRVLQVLWQQETPDFPLPEAYLTSPDR